MHQKKSSLVRTVKHIIIASNLFRQFHPESLFFSLQSIVYQHLIDLVHFVSSVTVCYSRVKRYFASLMLFYPIVDWAKNQPCLLIPLAAKMWWFLFYRNIALVAHWFKNIFSECLHCVMWSSSQNYSCSLRPLEFFANGEWRNRKTSIRLYIWLFSVSSCLVNEAWYTEPRREHLWCQVLV